MRDSATDVGPPQHRRSRIAGAIDKFLVTTDVALSKAVSVVNTYNGYVASRITDGNDSTFWSSTNPVTGKWFYIDCGAVAHVSSWRLRQNHNLGDCHTASQYYVQGSDDHSSWTTIVTHNVSARDETVNFPSEQAYRYYRFYATSSVGNCGWEVDTCELYGYF